MRQLVVFACVTAALAVKQANRFGGLDRYVGVGVAGGEGVVVGEDHVFGAVVAEGGFGAGADDGEGVEDVGRRVSLRCPDYRIASPQAW